MRKLTEKEITDLDVCMKPSEDQWQSILNITKKVFSDQPEKLEKALNAELKKFWLAPDEKLSEVLAEDNRFVDAMGLTHQELVEPLLFFEKMYDTSEVLYMGTKFALINTDLCQTPRSYESPFDKNGKNLGWNYLKKVTNLENGEEIIIGFPSLINEYGFYGGQKWRYRINPEQIVRVFPHLRK